MRKLFLLTLIIFAFASLSIAQTTFSPTIMHVSCPEQVAYDFGDEPLQIPVTVENLSGAFWLCINTVGKADQVDHVRNGYLGWHFVNNIDTTVYVSGRLPLEIGDNTITWDGTSSDSDPAVKLPEDTYAYYIYGYDDKTYPQRATSYARNTASWDCNQNFMVQYDEAGMALTKPVILGNNVWYHWGETASDQVEARADYITDHGSIPVYEEYGAAYKWELGANPDDINNLQTTFMPFYSTLFEGLGMFHAGQPVIDYTDHEYFYHICRDNMAFVCTMFRWKFIAGGDAERDDSFMGFENVTWDLYPVQQFEVPTLGTLEDGSSPYYYSSDLIWHIPAEQWTPLTCINIDEGAVVFDIQMDEYYMPDQDNGNNEFNMTPDAIYSREENKLLLGSWAGCLQEMIDTTALLTDPYDKDYVLWQNANGDYFMDKKYLPTDTYQWICSAIDERPTVQGCSLDSQNLGIMWTRGPENINQVIVSQDGQGIAKVNFFGQDSGVRSSTGLWCDSGSQYDGVYMPRPQSTDQNPTTRNMLFYKPRLRWWFDYSGRTGS